MNIDAKSLGASVYRLPENTSCQVCNLSIGDEKLFCDRCGSIGHKHCFNTLSPLKGQSRKYTLCKKLQCTGELQRKKTQLAVQRAQKNLADKMLLNMALRLPPLSIGNNVRVPIPKVDKGKLGPNHILGVITKVSNNSYYIGTEKGTLDRNYSRGEIEFWTDSSYLSVQDIPATEIKCIQLLIFLMEEKTNVYAEEIVQRNIVLVKLANSIALLGVIQNLTVKILIIKIFYQQGWGWLTDFLIRLKIFGNGG